MLCFQTVIKEDLPRKAKTLSSNSDKLLNHKITQQKLQQGMEGVAVGGWDSQGLGNTHETRSKCASNLSVLVGGACKYI